MISQLLSVFVLIQVYMLIWFLVSLVLKRNDVADLAWGLGFILVSVYLFISGGLQPDHMAIVTLATTVWGIRLASHIYKRLKSRREDSRYLAWRNTWGKYFVLRSYLQVFVLQGIIMFLISFSAIVASQNRGLPIQTPFVFLGIIVWLLGFIMESTADSQLSKFVGNPENKGHVMQSGVWKYSRHPNYFGEVTQWWGLFILVSSLSSGWLAITSPLTITSMILFISGVPMLESKYAGRPEFESYKKRTSIFIPWFPGK